MVLRGRRTALSNSATVTSSTSRWSRNRPNSAADGDTRGANSVRGGKSSRGGHDVSAKSSPGATEMTRSSSPFAKKHGKPMRGTNSWRARGGGGGGGPKNMTSSGLVTPKDPKFTITSEDFPALPGCKDGEEAGEEGEIISGISTTDDSGLSSSSRWEAPSRGESEESEKEKDKENGKKYQTPRKHSASPIKEYRGGNTTPKGGYHHRNNFGKGPNDFESPKKRNNHHSNTSPSFIKLSKTGQKLAERRGGMRNGSFSPNSPKQFSDFQKGKEKKEGKMESPTKKEAKIVLGEDGELLSIPDTMIKDQFGLAALVPMLITYGQKSQAIPKEMRNNGGDLEEMIEKLAIGIDLNSLGVPTKNMDQKPVWKNFSGPYRNVQHIPTEMSTEFCEVPTAYSTARSLQGSIDMSSRVPEKFGDQELLFVFYNFPGEIWQMNAARELQFRGWRYEMVEKLWVNRKNPQCSSVEELLKGGSGDGPVGGALGDDEYCTGVFQFYDPDKARITYREFHTLWSNFEEPAWLDKDCDEATKKFLAMMTSDTLWGPSNKMEDEGGWWKNGQLGGTTGGFGMAGIPGKFEFNRFGSNQLPQHQQQQLMTSSTSTSSTSTPAAAKRILSFAESVDFPMNSSPSSMHSENNTNNTTMEENYRQHVYSMMMQQIQTAQNQQQQPNNRQY